MGPLSRPGRRFPATATGPRALSGSSVWRPVGALGFHHLPRPACLTSRAGPPPLPCRARLRDAGACPGSAGMRLRGRVPAVTASHRAGLCFGVPFGSSHGGFWVPSWEARGAASCPYAQGLPGTLLSTSRGFPSWTPNLGLTGKRVPCFAVVRARPGNVNVGSAQLQSHLSP